MREAVVEKNAAEKRPYNKAVSSHPYCVSRPNKEAEKYNKETDGRECSVLKKVDSSVC